MTNKKFGTVQWEWARVSGLEWEWLEGWGEGERNARGAGTLLILERQGLIGLTGPHGIETGRIGVSNRRRAGCFVNHLALVGP